MTGEREVNKAWFYAVLVWFVFATQNAVMMVPPLLVEISTDLDVSVALAGQLGTATFVGWAVSVLATGPLSDSLGRRPVALAGLALLTASVLGSLFAPNIETLLALRFLTGLGGGTVPPNSVGVLSDVISPARRAQAVTGMLAVNSVAAAVGGPLAAALADLAGWRFAFLVSGALLGLALISIWIWYPRDRGDRVRNWEFLSRYRALASVRYFRVGVPVAISQRTAFWGMLSFYPAYLINTYHLGIGFAALPLAMVATAGVIGSYFAAFVVPSRRRALLIASTSVAGGACALVCFSAGLTLWASVAAATVGTGLLSVAIPAMVSISTEYSGDSKATGASLMGLSNQSGGALGAGIAGAILAGAGYAGIGYLLLAATIVCAMLTPLFGREFGEAAGRGE